MALVVLVLLVQEAALGVGVAAVLTLKLQIFRSERLLTVGLSPHKHTIQMDFTKVFMLMILTAIPSLVLLF
jgi:hypothetical protein